MVGVPIVNYLAGGAIVFVFLEGSFSKEKLGKSPIPKLVLLFWIWLVVTIVIGKLYIGGAPWVITHFGRVAVLYYLIVLTVDSLPRLKLFIWILLLLTSFLAVDAIVQFYTGFSLLGAQALDRSVAGGESIVKQARGIGIFSDPNDLALYIAPMLAFLMPSFHKRAISKTIMTGVILLIPLITGIIYTRSRGGILAMAFVAWVYMRHRVGLTFSVVGLVMLFGLLMAIPRFGSTDVSHGTAQSRFDHWAYGLGQFRTHPVFGMGYKGFTSQGYHHTAHNSFVLVLAETGAIGTILWISLIYAAGRHIFAMERITRGPPWVPPLSKALEAAMGSWMVAAFFLSQAYGFMLFILLGLITANVNILGQQNLEIGFHWSFRQTRNATLVTLGVILLIHFMVRFLTVLS